MSLVCGFAFWRGGRPEKVTAAACIAAWFASPLAQNNNDWFNPNWGVLGVDILLLAVLVWQSLTENRIWLLFAAAFQLLGVVIHLAIVADDGVRPMPYRQGLVIWSYLVLAALAVGTWGVWRGRRGDNLTPRL